MHKGFLSLFYLVQEIINYKKGLREENGQWTLRGEDKCYSTHTTIPWTVSESFREFYVYLLYYPPH